jgi:hypothetical protein
MISLRKHLHSNFVNYSAYFLFIFIVWVQMDVFLEMRLITFFVLASRCLVALILIFFFGVNVRSNHPQFVNSNKTANHNFLSINIKVRNKLEMGCPFHNMLFKIAHQCIKNKKKCLKYVKNLQWINVWKLMNTEPTKIESKWLGPIKNCRNPSRFSAVLWVEWND